MEVTETVNYCSPKTKNDVESSKENNIEIPSIIEQMISDLIKDEGYTQCEVTKNPFNTGGGNYLGELLEVDINGKTKDGDKKINAIIKIKVSGESVKEFLNVSSMYNQELIAYTALGEAFTTLQEEACIPHEERFKMAKCYSQSNENAIILENLSRRGFNLLHRMDTISMEFATKSIEELSKFHSLSIILENKKPKEFEILKNSFKQVAFINEEWMGFCKSLVDTYIHEFDEEMQKKVENVCSKMLNKTSDYFSGKIGSLKCFTHGDYRINNMLKKETDGKIVELIPIDYQFVFPRSPVIDIIYLIYTATDKKFRKQHTQDLLDIYHETMKDFLSYFNLDVETIYPKDQFLKEFFDSLDYGLINAMFILPLCYVTEESVPDFSDYNKSSIKVNEGIKERISDVFDEFMELGIL